MSETHIRGISETRAATRLSAATAEPSHIHIPRPSRRVRPSVTLAGQSAPEARQLEPTLQDAA